MELTYILGILLKYRRMLILLTASAVVNAVVATYVVPEKYESNVLVLVRPTEEIDITPVSGQRETLNFPLPQLVPFDAMSRTFGEVIRSRAVVGEIVRRLGGSLSDDDQSWWSDFKSDVFELLKDGWDFLRFGRVEESDPVTDAEERLQENLSVEPTRDTYVFEISYADKNPHLTAAVVNLAAEVFVEYNRELDRSEGGEARDFIATQLQESEGALENARDSLRAFKDENEVVNVGEEISSTIEGLAAFEVDLERMNHEIVAARAEIAELETQLADEEEYLRSETRTEDNPLIRDLTYELVQHQIELSGLEATLTPSHPRVVSLRATIAETERSLREEFESTQIVSSETSAINTVRQTLTTSFLEEQAELSRSQARAVNLKASIAKYRRELAEYPEKQQRLDELELDVKVAQDTHLFISQAYDEARIRTAGQIDEIRVLSAGKVAVYPVSPVKVYFAALAFILALVTGVAVCLLLEYIRPTVSTVEEATKALDLPLLATVPRVDSPV